MNELMKTQTQIRQVDDKTLVQQNYYVQLPKPTLLDTLAKLHPVTQITAMVSMIGMGYFALSFASIAFSGLAAFSLTLLAIMSNFIITIGVGVGILLLVIIGITGITKL